VERKCKVTLEVQRWKFGVRVILKVNRCYIRVGVKLEVKWWSLNVGV